MSETNAAVAALLGGGRRAKVHDEMLPIKHPKAVRALVKEVAASEGVTEATVWRNALGEYLERRGYTA